MHPGQAVALTTDFGDAAGQVTGTVYDSSNTALAYKSVTLTGSAGVYFSTSATPDANNPLVTSITTTTSSTGAISGVYAFFTKPGAGSITATSGSVHADAAFSTDESADGYSVTVNAAAGAPGDVLVLTGTVSDAFGFPAKGVTVDLSTGTSTLGALGATSVTTNAEGVWSTTYVTGTNQSGRRR